MEDMKTSLQSQVGPEKITLYANHPLFPAAMAMKEMEIKLYIANAKAHALRDARDHEHAQLVKAKKRVKAVTHQLRRKV